MLLFIGGLYTYKPALAKVANSDDGQNKANPDDQRDAELQYENSTKTKKESESD